MLSHVRQILYIIRLLLFSNFHFILHYIKDAIVALHSFAYCK